MKNARVGWKMVVGVAAALALSAGASAQRTGGGRGGIPLSEGSLENDIREGRGPRQAPKPGFAGEVVVDLDGQLGLQFDVQPTDGMDALGLFPLAQDMNKSIRLAGGTPGSLAVIYLAPQRRRLSHRDTGLMGGAVISGYFGFDGSFVVDLPPELDVRGLAAQGAQIEGRLVTRVVDLDEAVEEAFATWITIGRVNEPQQAGGVGKGTELRRPSRSSGHAAQGATIEPGLITVELDNSEVVDEEPFASWTVLDTLPAPQQAGGVSGGKKLPRPVRGGGHSGRR